jgi:hypothetical protein
MRARSPLALLFVLLVGCPDAQRGEAPNDPDRGDPDGGGTPGDAQTPPTPDGGSTEPRVLQKIAEVSGNLVVSGDRVFVTAKPGIVAFPASGGPTVPIVTGDVHYTLAADQDRLFYVSDTMSLGTVGHTGDGFVALANDAAGFTVAVDDQRVYWAASTSQVKSVLKGGTAPAILRKADNLSDPVFLAVTEHALVIAVWEPLETAFRIVRHPKDSDAPDISLATASKVLALRTQGHDAYWTESGAAIRAAAVEGNGHPVAIAGDPALFDTSALAVDDAYVYWASRHYGRVYRAARATGIPEILAEGLIFTDQPEHYYGYAFDRGVGRLAVDSAFVYVSDSRGVFRTRK